MVNKVSERSRLRVYVTETQEVFELIDGKTKKINRFVLSYGESLARLAEGWEAEDMHLLKQIEACRWRAGEHDLFQLHSVHNPFFCLLDVMRSAYPQTERDTKEILSFFRNGLQESRADARRLLADCLSMNSDLLKRHWELWHGAPLILPPINMELLPVKVEEHSNECPTLVDLEFMHRMDIEMKLGVVGYPETAQELYNFLKFIYLQRAVRFKPCQLCGKLFAAIDGDRTEYCYRRARGKKTCRDIDAGQIHREKMLSDPIACAYNQAYKTHNARIRYGIMTREEFKDWAAEAKHLRDACQSGVISLDRFEAWLKQ